MQERAASTDGHALILGHIGTLAVNPFIFDKLPFDTNRDFRLVSLLAKSKPGQLNYGSAGNGSAGHLAFEYLKMVSAIFVLHVPYRGTARSSPTCWPAGWMPPA